MAIGEEKVKPISFRKLMQLKQTDTHDVFESITPAWPTPSPPATGPRAFGGHVYAQSGWAASKTVGRGYVIHNVTGHFLLAGDVTMPFVYHVQRVRDGGVYCLRKVEVFQDSRTGGGGGGGGGRRVPCFVSTISFKRAEQQGKTMDFGHQDVARNHVLEEYERVLKGKAPEDHDIAPGADTNWWDEGWTEELGEHARMFPGVELRKVDMRPYNGVAVPGGGVNGEVVSRWRQLTFYRMRKEGPGDLDEMNLNLHACAHLYASDRNGLYMVQRALGYEKELAKLGSLAHTVLFHGSSEDLRMVDSRDNDKWFVQEAWTSASGDNRIVHNSRLWDIEEGRMIAQTLQDGMMRLPLPDIESKL